MKRLYPCPGYLWNWPTELTEVPGTHRSPGYSGTGVQNLHKFRAGMKRLYPYRRYLWHWLTELPEVPGTGINVLHNLQKFRVRVIPR